MVRRGWLDLFRSSLSSCVPWEQIPEGHGQLLGGVGVGQPRKAFEEGLQGCAVAQRSTSLLFSRQSLGSAVTRSSHVVTLKFRLCVMTFPHSYEPVSHAASPSSCGEHQCFLRRAWWDLEMKLACRQWDPGVLCHNTSCLSSHFPGQVYHARFWVAPRTEPMQKLEPYHVSEGFCHWDKILSKASYGR